jgi:hypothetical protein
MSIKRLIFYSKNLQGFDQEMTGGLARAADSADSPQAAVAPKIVQRPRLRAVND